MSKKKKQDKNTFNSDQLDMEVSVMEEPMDEDEENDESEQEDVFAEDESDIAMMHNLEIEDNQIALSEIVFEEEAGFNPMFDWSTLAESERSRFSSLMSLDKEAVESYAWKRLGTLQRWMYARACAKVGLHEQFREISLGILKMRKPIPELCLEDIYLELVWDYVETKEYDEALSVLDKFEQAYPDEKPAAYRVRALIMMDMGEIDKGKAIIEQLLNLPFNHGIKGFEDDKSYRSADMNDGLLQYEIGYALLSMNHVDLAMHYFDRARNLANMNDNYELTMAIDNARAAANKRLNVEE
jgi:tetratricopeptide (TPR) repeat protein